MPYIEAQNGGGSIDLLNPIGKLAANYTSASGTVDVTVTQSPKWILLTTVPNAGSGASFSAVIDAVNNTAKRSGYSSSGAYTWQDWAQSAWSQYITAVTDSYVRYNKATFGAGHKVYIEVY